MSPNNEPIDNLWVFPNKNTAYEEKFKQFAAEKKIKYWFGMDTDQRFLPVKDIKQYRLLYYESARGVEGFSVICLGLDLYFSSIANTSSIERAKNWVMIALSRASNNLVIHIENRGSFIGSMLREIYEDKIHERGKSEFLIEWRTI